MADLGQNTVTNRQAVIDLIDESSGGGGAPTLAQVLAAGNVLGDLLSNEIYSNDELKYININDSNIVSLSSNGTNYTSLEQITPGSITHNSVDSDAGQNTSIYQATDLAGIVSVLNADLANITRNRISVNNAECALLHENEGSSISNKFSVDILGFKLAALSAYDDDDAAILAGLTAGYIYQTTGSGTIPYAGVICVVQ